MLGRSGHVFERSAITAWLSSHNTDPLTNARLATDNDKTLHADLDLLREIQDFVASIAGMEIPSQEMTVGRRLARGANKIDFRKKGLVGVF